MKLVLITGMRGFLVRKEPESIRFIASVMIYYTILTSENWIQYCGQTNNRTGFHIYLFHNPRFCLCFSLTNYQSGLTETKIAGETGQVSEVRQEGNLKFLYKLKVDESALKKRNINPRLTAFRKESIAASQVAGGQALQYQQKKKSDTVQVQTDIFESEFDKEKLDTVLNQKLILQAPPPEPPDAILKNAKLFDYTLKFNAQSFTAGFNNDVLVTQYQPFTGSLPIMLGGNEPFNAMFKATVVDLFEDIRFLPGLCVFLCLAAIMQFQSVLAQEEQAFLPLSL